MVQYRRATSPWVQSRSPQQHTGSAGGGWDQQGFLIAAQVSLESFCQPKSAHIAGYFCVSLFGCTCCVCAEVATCACLCGSFWPYLSQSPQLDHELASTAAFCVKQPALSIFPVSAHVKLSRTKEYPTTRLFLFLQRVSQLACLASKFLLSKRHRLACVRQQARKKERRGEGSLAVL